MLFFNCCLSSDTHSRGNKFVSFFLPVDFSSFLLKKLKVFLASGSIYSRSPQISFNTCSTIGFWSASGTSSNLFSSVLSCLLLFSALIQQRLKYSSQMCSRVTAYHLIQLGTSLALLGFVEQLRDPSSVLFLLYWLFTAITITAYWVAHCKDPGAYTEHMQESQTLRPELTDTANTNANTTAAASDSGTFSSLKTTPHVKNAQDHIEIQEEGPESKKQISNESVEQKQPSTLDTLRVYQDSHQIPLCFCRLCNVDQPIRTKHCHSCQKCILTFDHHCPWLDNCVGEKNRPHFFAYSLIQTGQVGFAIALLLWKTVVDRQWLIIPLVIVLLGVFILMLSLLASHTYLMITGHTTWEYLSWKKISYLQDKEKEFTSPFSEGICNNIKLYWALGFRSRPYQWTFKR